MVDVHLHTTYSFDSTATPSGIIARAREMGLSGVCFTDHWDVGYDSINEEKIVPGEYARCDLWHLRTLPVHGRDVSADVGAGVNANARTSADVGTGVSANARTSADAGTGASASARTSADVGAGASASARTSAGVGAGASASAGTDINVSGGFSVLCGIELAPMPHVLGRVKAEMADTSFDFILLSAHYVEKVPQVRYKSFFVGREKVDAYERYLQTLISLIKQYGDYDALGHYDYISRYSPYPDPIMRYSDHECAFDELFGLLIKQGKALEVNTANHRNVHGGLPFDRRVIERYRDLGGELVCLGSDAHRESSVGNMFGEYRQILKEYGFKSLVHYVERKPVETGI